MSESRTARQPLVSVVTPSLNMAAWLPQCIASVLSQDYPRIEHIVSDGGSTDGTLDVLSTYGDKVIVRSAKDRGPADAIDLGFRMARGEILAWLNADDTYLPGAVRAAVEFLEAYPEIDVVYGEGYWIDEKGGRIGPYPTLPWDARVLERDCFICQPAAFIRADAYRRCGLDPDVNPSFDYDLWIRMAQQGLRFAHIPQFLANSRLHSGATTVRQREAVFQASMDLLRRHYGYVPLSWVFGYTAYRADGRDQIFEPMRPSLRKYVMALPMGIRLNPLQRARFVGEWLSAPFLAAWRRLWRRGSPIPL